MRPSVDLVGPFRTGLLLPTQRFEPLLSRSVDHLISERPRYGRAARQSVLGRSWPAICGQLLDHYDAVINSFGKDSRMIFSHAEATCVGNGPVV